MSQIYNGNIKRPKLQDTPLEILLKNSTEGLRSRREHRWSYVLSAFKNTTKNVAVQGRVQLEHSSHIVKVGVKATCSHFNH